MPDPLDTARGVAAVTEALRRPIPSGCRWCGLPARGHAQRHPGSGIPWHSYAEPTQPQILARMRARRAARHSRSTA